MITARLAKLLTLLSSYRTLVSLASTRLALLATLASQLTDVCDASSPPEFPDLAARVTAKLAQRIDRVLAEFRAIVLGGRVSDKKPADLPGVGRAVAALSRTPVRASEPRDAWEARPEVVSGLFAELVDATMADLERRRDIALFVRLSPLRERKTTKFPTGLIDLRDRRAGSN